MKNKFTLFVQFTALSVCVPFIQANTQEKYPEQMPMKPEIQILDNYNNPTYVNDFAASVYKQSPPLVNPIRKPG